MPAYLIVLRESPIRDTEAFADYQRKTRETIGEYKLKPLVIYGSIQTLEGETPDGMVMLEFPTVEEASAWYNSAGYQAALPYRLKSAPHRAFIVDGIGHD